MGLRPTFLTENFPSPLNNVNTAFSHFHQCNNGGDIVSKLVQLLKPTVVGCYLLFLLRALLNLNLITVVT